MSTIVYLAGPMAGHPDYNRPAFHAAAKTLREQGYVVWSPAEQPDDLHQGTDGEPISPDARAAYLKRDIAVLAQCEQIVVLEGWEDSTGTCCEMLAAGLMGMPVGRWNKDTGQIEPFNRRKAWVPMPTIAEHLYAVGFVRLEY